MNGSEGKNACRNSMPSTRPSQHSSTTAVPSPTSKSLPGMTPKLTLGCTRLSGSERTRRGRRGMEGEARIEPEIVCRCALQLQRPGVPHKTQAQDFASIPKVQYRLKVIQGIGISALPTERVGSRVVEDGSYVECEQIRTRRSTSASTCDAQSINAKVSMMRRMRGLPAIGESPSCRMRAHWAVRSRSPILLRWMSGTESADSLRQRAATGAEQLFQKDQDRGLQHRAS